MREREKEREREEFTMEVCEAEIGEIRRNGVWGQGVLGQHGEVGGGSFRGEKQSREQLPFVAFTTGHFVYQEDGRPVYVEADSAGVRGGWKVPERVRWGRAIH